MRGFEQFLVAEPANGTGLPVGAQDPFTKSLLVDPLPHESGDIPTANISFGRLGALDCSPVLHHLHHCKRLEGSVNRSLTGLEGVSQLTATTRPQRRGARRLGHCSSARAPSEHEREDERNDEQLNARHNSSRQPETRLRVWLTDRFQTRRFIVAPAAVVCKPLFGGGQAASRRSANVHCDFKSRILARVGD